MSALDHKSWWKILTTILAGLSIYPDPILLLIWTIGKRKYFIWGLWILYFTLTLHESILVASKLQRVKQTSVMWDWLDVGGEKAWLMSEWRTKWVVGPLPLPSSPCPSKKSRSGVPFFVLTCLQTPRLYFYLDLICSLQQPNHVLEIDASDVQ